MINSDRFIGFNLIQYKQFLLPRMSNWKKVDACVD